MTIDREQPDRRRERQPTPDSGSRVTVQTPTPTPEPAAGGTARAGWVVLVLVFAGFISLGLPDGLLGVAFPSIRQTFSLKLDALGAVFLTGVCGYLAASLASGWVVDRIGVAMLLTLSAFATAISLLGYAFAPSWWVIVALGLVSGLGAGAIDAGLNAYVALTHSSRLLAWLHACFGLGAAAGPAIMTAVLEGGRPWQLGYILVGTVQLGLGICFLLTRQRWQAAPAPASASQRDAASAAPDALADAASTSAQIDEPRALRLLAEPAVWLTIVLFVVYTGTETAAGQWAYTLLVEGRSASPQLAGMAVSGYWGALALGRVLAGLIGDRVAPVTMLRACMLGMLAGAALLWLNLAPWLSIAGLGLIGLAAAPVFPAMIGVTPARFGAAHATTLIGFQVAAASLGIAGLPAITGVLAARTGLEIIPLLLMLSCLLMIGLHELVLRLVARLHVVIRPSPG
ncbi:MAG: MFS transporter [Chloroflexi bacterium]|nr:MFS transporter [Chloroflexota bacterium]